MCINKKISIPVIAAILLFPLYVFAETLVFGVFENIPPFQYQENAQFKGIDIDIANELSRQLNVKIEFKELPWARMKKYAEEGSIDAILSMFCMDKYLNIVDYAESPIKSVISVFALKESNINVKNLDDLKGKKIGVIRGYTYSSEFSNYKDLRKIECNNDGEVLKRLNEGRIDVAVAESIPFHFLAKKQGIDDKLNELYTISENKLCIGFSKKALGPESKVWADKTVKIFDELIENGFIQNVMDKNLK
ncbi:Extracellular solute-binding protein, family 3 [Desulfonema limicola]|uniref:Extracellular solute-binding protein, family 3 n=1 Tax=Desulfonema limicola TaxID=45656 RepID=A0A975B340_9BACT|nr:transporter substrate-binding domain-containing protein [Desulfonema limicola]QTA77899.1 Extracellular solute-binding protein, family 3 [Desulfonema limicola]